MLPVLPVLEVSCKIISDQNIFFPTTFVIHSAGEQPRTGSCRLHFHGSLEILAGVDGIVTQLLLDPENLVQLGQTLGTAGSPGLDLTSPQAHHDVGDGNVLRLSRSMGHHDTPVGGVGILGRLDSLGESADLIDF